jgi:integrase
MGRSASVSQPHPSPRFRDKIRLRQGRRGPTDEIWCATFKIDGKWQSTKPANLGTRDFAEACEVARDKYAAMNGHGVHSVLRTYKTPEPPKPNVQHPFRLYAERAIAKLKEQAIQADAEAVGKGHNFLAIARRIENDLIPHWGDTDITAMTEHTLNDWVADEYRVEDTDATVARYGRQGRSEGRQKVWKKPSATTLGNLDWALRHVWMEAVGDKIVDRRHRPMMDKSLGEDGEPRPFIDASGVLAVAKVMSDQWVTAPSDDGPEHGSDMKRMLRTYVAMIATTGIRAGLEAKRVQIGNVQFLTQHGQKVILIYVVKRQGKHGKGRSVIVYEGDPAFNIRKLLADHIAWRRSQGASDRDYLFAWPDGSFPVLRDALNTVLTKADALVDPMTGERRVAYSFRHYFATKLIEQGLSLPVIAEWLGTSSAMVERHYNRFLTERNAHLLNGASVRWKEILRQMPHPVDPWETDRDIAEQIAGR